MLRGSRASVALRCRRRYKRAVAVRVSRDLGPTNRARPRGVRGDLPTGSGARSRRRGAPHERPGWLAVVSPDVLRRAKIVTREDLQSPDDSAPDPASRTPSGPAVSRLSPSFLQHVLHGRISIRSVARACLARVRPDRVVFRGRRGHLRCDGAEHHCRSVWRSARRSGRPPNARARRDHDLRDRLGGSGGHYDLGGGRGLAHRGTCGRAGDGGRVHAAVAARTPREPRPARVTF